MVFFDPARSVNASDVLPSEAGWRLLKLKQLRRTISSDSLG